MVRKSPEKSLNLSVTSQGRKCWCVSAPSDWPADWYLRWLSNYIELKDCRVGSMVSHRDLFLCVRPRISLQYIN